MAGGVSPYVPTVPGHRQFLDQISVKTFVGTPSFYFEMFKICWFYEQGCSHPYVPPVPGHGQFLDQISVKTYVGTPSFLLRNVPD